MTMLTTGIIVIAIVLLIPYILLEVFVALGVGIAKAVKSRIFAAQSAASIAKQAIDAAKK